MAEFLTSSFQRIQGVEVAAAQVRVVGRRVAAMTVCTSMP